jgi:hypothetical protein
MVVIGMVMRARQARRRQRCSIAFAFQGAGPRSEALQPRQYNPKKWATTRRPVPGSRTMPATGGSMIGSGLAGSQNWGVPADFDAEGFLAAKRNFVTLQAAWDRPTSPRCAP